MSREQKVTLLGRTGCEALNESASQVYAGDVLLSRIPSDPAWWFYTLAIGARAHTFGPALRALLSPESMALIDHVNIGAFTNAVAECDDDERLNPWCMCCNEALMRAGYRNDGWGGWCGESWSGIHCWPCLFGEHEQCRLEWCDTVGEIHFPEKILSKAAA